MKEEAEQGPFGAEGTGAPKGPAPQIDSEIPPIPKRRYFPKEYRLKILKELDQCSEPGQKGLIIRREGLYSSQISQWRKWRQDMGSKAKKAPSNKERNELARANRKIIRLEAQLEKANKLIEIQKKMAEFVQSWEKENTDENPSK